MKKMLHKIASFLAGSRKSSSCFIEYDIKCGKCGEIVKIRVFPERDLNPTYDDNGPAYILKKEVMDSKCFRMISVEISYDSSRREISREISGGTFV
jgi:CMP-N-acetylneuraminic acid synthetase